GAGGSNAHVILEEWTESADSPAPVIAPVLIALSAKTAEQLRDVALNLHRNLAKRNSAGGFDLRAVARTLQAGRVPMEHRLAFIARDELHLLDMLQAWLNGDDF